jgi:hypothetical protein
MMRAGFSRLLFHLFGVPLVCVAFLVAVTSACASTQTHGHSRHTTGHHFIHLTWQPGLGGSAVRGYNVYRAVAGQAGHFNKVNPAPVPKAEYDDRTVQSGMTYLYVVRMVDTKGKESGPSNQIKLAVP